MHGHGVCLLLYLIHERMGTSIFERVQHVKLAIILRYVIVTEKAQSEANMHWPLRHYSLKIFFTFVHKKTRMMRLSVNCTVLRICKTLPATLFKVHICVGEGRHTHSFA